MDNFEEMTNQELHTKLLEFGFPNMPVTQTTRKLMIRKLSNHIDGGNKDNKSRRETIHQVMKYSSDEDTTKIDKKETKEEATKVVKKNRRATIGGDKLSKTMPLAISTPEQLKSTRKSGRVTPLALASSRTITTSFAPPTEKEKAIVIDEESDEELQFSQMPKSKRSSKSKSPSPLSKGQTITTSYVNVVEKQMIPEFDEMDVDSDEAMVIDEDIVEEPIKPPTPILKKRSVSRISTNEHVSSTSRKPMFNLTVGHERAVDTTEPFDTPYLSEFARRLTLLTAEHNKEPVFATKKPVAAPIQTQYSDFSRPSQYQLKHLTGVQPKKKAASENGIRESLYAVVTALDRNFPIRKALFYTLILLTVIFVYVFFFM